MLGSASLRPRSGRGQGGDKPEFGALRHRATGRYRTTIHRSPDRPNPHPEPRHRNTELDTVLEPRLEAPKHEPAGLARTAFDPGYASNGKFYLDFVVPGGKWGNGTTHVSQYQVSAGNRNVADPASERCC